MDVLIGASKSDLGTEHLAALVRPHLDELSSSLSGDYGGPVVHLWIDLELCPGDAGMRPAFPFRLQKRVRTPTELRSLGDEQFFNVGNYSVRPDYFELARIPLDDMPCCLMTLLYESTRSLCGKRQLKDFDVESFLRRFAGVPAARGCTKNA